MNTKPATILPEDYASIGALDLANDTRAFFAMNVAGIVLLVFFGWFFYRVLFWVRPSVSLQVQSPGISWDLLVMVLALVAIQVGVIVIHEAIHGVCFYGFTRQTPKFAFKGGYAYAAAPGWYLPRRLYWVVAGAPFFAISAAGVALMTVIPADGLLALTAGIVLNAAGSVGDLAVMAWLAFSPRGTVANDRGDAVELFAPKPQN